MPDTGVAQKMPTDFNPDEHENTLIVYGWQVVDDGPMNRPRSWLGKNKIEGLSADALPARR
jgi:hypothetical protein